MWTPPQRLITNDPSPLALLLQRFGAAPAPGELPAASQQLLRDLPDHLLGVLRARDGGPVSVWDSLHGLS